MLGGTPPPHPNTNVKGSGDGPRGRREPRPVATPDRDDRGGPARGARAVRPRPPGQAIVVTMTTTCTRPPGDVEYKTAPTMLVPRPS